MIIVYDSLTGLGKQFAEGLGYPIQSIDLAIEEPCILVTRNVGLGNIPDTTSLFLDKHRTYVKGVVVNGSKRFGPFYCKAGDKINKLYKIPVIRKISGAGNQKDLEAVREYITAKELLQKR